MCYKQLHGGVSSVGRALVCGTSGHGFKSHTSPQYRQSEWYPFCMKQYKYLGLITVLYVTFQLVSDITAGKIVQLGMFTVSATVLYFPVTFILADVLTEVYGFARARSVLWQVLMASVVAGLVYQIVIWLPAVPGFDGVEAYARVLGSVPRILIGGWIAVWAGSILNDYVMAKMKVWSSGKHLWARTIGSTIIGEGANTILFYVIALYAIIPNNILVASVLSGWFLKVMVEILMTPVTYAVVKRLKVSENEDFYDTATDFNPLKI